MVHDNGMRYKGKHPFLKARLLAFGYNKSRKPVDIIKLETFARVEFVAIFYINIKSEGPVIINILVRSSLPILVTLCDT